MKEITEQLKRKWKRE